MQQDFSAALPGPRAAGSPPQRDASAFIVEFQPNYVVPAVAAVKGAQTHGIYIIQLRYATKEAPSA